MNRTITKSSGMRTTLTVLALAFIGMAAGCRQAPEAAGTTATAERAPTTPSDIEQEQGAGQSPVSDADFSFEGYSLPVACRRTSDARELTPGGNFRNVIVFACRSHDVDSAASAMKTHMQAHGRSVSEEKIGGVARVMVATMPGTANTTIRVSPIGDGEADAGSRLRLQWFSKD